MPPTFTQKVAQVRATHLEKVVVDLAFPLYEIEDTLNSLFERIDSHDVSTREMRVPLELSLPGEARQTSFDLGDLGRGTGSDWDEARVTTIDFALAIESSMAVQWTGDTRSKAVVDVASRDFANAMLLFKVIQDKLAQTAGNGVLAVVAAAPVGTALTLGGTYTAQLLRKKQWVQVVDPTLNIVRGLVRLKTVNYRTATVYADPLTPWPVGTAANDRLVFEGVPIPAALSKYGLDYHMDDTPVGFWLGLDKSLLPEIVPTAIDAGGGALTPLLVNDALTELEIDKGQDLVNQGSWFWYMHSRRHKEWVNQLTLVASVDLPTGGSNNASVDLVFSRKKNKTAGGHPIFPSSAADPRKVRLIDKKNWMRATSKRMGLLEVGGRKRFELRGTGGGVQAGEIYYVGCSEQLVTKDPKRGITIKSLNP